MLLSDWSFISKLLRHFSLSQKTSKLQKSSSKRQIPSKRLISLLFDWSPISKLLRHFSLSPKTRKLHLKNQIVWKTVQNVGCAVQSVHYAVFKVGSTLCIGLLTIGRKGGIFVRKGRHKKRKTKKAIPIILSHKRNVKLSRWFARIPHKISKLIFV